MVKSEQLFILLNIKLRVIEYVMDIWRCKGGLVEWI